MYYPILGISMRGFNDASIGMGGNTSSLEVLTAHELFRRNIISTNNVSCAVKISDDSYNFVGSSEESSIIPEGDFFSKAEVLLKAMGTPENDIPNVMPMIKECITPITEEEYLNFNGE